MDNPIVNIITRTSNRPRYFDRNYKSVKSQNYKNIIHHVISDSKDDDYVKEYNDILLYRVNKPEITTEKNPFNTGPLSLYNLYFNSVIPLIKEGWIIFLDDDDYLAHDNVITEIIGKIKSNDDLIIFQMEYENGKKLPDKQHFFKTPTLGTIGSPCFCVHSSKAKLIKWDKWKCADYRYIKGLWGITNKKTWLHKTMVKIGGEKGLGNLGQRNDITLKNNDKIDYIFVIPTYNRNSKIIKLVDNILDIFKNHKIKIIIYDDCSNIPITMYNSDIIILRGLNRNGKKKYYLTVNELIKNALKFEFSWLIQLDDDMLVSHNLPSLLKEYKDEKVIKLHRDNRNYNWETYNWVDGGTAYSYDFIKNVKIPKMNPIRWVVNPNISSGVWHYMTDYINQNNVNVVKPFFSHLYHNDKNISKMNEYRNDIEENLITQNYIDKINVIMCVYKRLERLPKTIKMLSEQTIKNFNLIIWNNSEEENCVIEKIIKKSNIQDFSYSVMGLGENIGGIGRFYAAKETTETNSKIIFIDDDQVFGEDMIINFISEYEPKSIKSWWAWKFKSDSNYYNRRKITLQDENCHYCGTGGMILSNAVFKEEELFNVPEKYKFIEDLWLSYFCNHHLKYKLKHTQNNIKIEVDGKDQYHHLTSLKSDFLKYLTNDRNWKLL